MLKFTQLILGELLAGALCLAAFMSAFLASAATPTLWCQAEISKRGLPTGRQA
jgi:hypothetical protein